MANEPKTNFECRGCGRIASEVTLTEIVALGWGEVKRIDGPNKVCPDCLGDESACTALEYIFKENGYSAAHIVPLV